MTDTSSAQISFEPLGPGPEYHDSSIWLPQLFLETRRAGGVNIEGRIFVDCMIEGPAVMLPLEGCDFADCNMGDAMGDTRNLLLKPVGSQRVTGAIPIMNCRFIRCRFLGVGFTGTQGFLDAMIAGLGDAPA